ncbi:MAG: DUF3105 domain-containing protein [Microbacteriaceae bacterium]
MSAQSKREAAQARRLKVEQFKREQRARERRRRLLLIGGVLAACVTVAGVIVAVVASQPATSRAAAGAQAQIIPSTPTGATTSQHNPTRVADTSGISGVLAWDTQGWPGDGTDHPDALEHDHLAGPVTYAITPPVGGPHNAIWMNAGVYTKPVPTERAVHNLEHGAIWITYNPNLGATQLRELTDFVTKQTLIPEQEQNAAGQNISGQANRYIDLSPWSTNSLPSPIVISAWGHQLRVKTANDPRLQEFVNTFRHNPKYTPEYGAPVDGIPIQTGGRPASDGSKLANPSGAA